MGAPHTHHSCTHTHWEIENGPTSRRIRKEPGKRTAPCDASYGGHSLPGCSERLVKLTSFPVCACGGVCYLLDVCEVIGGGCEGDFTRALSKARWCKVWGWHTGGVQASFPLVPAHFQAQWERVGRFETA